jgi:hypothetical protein
MGETMSETDRSNVIIHRVTSSRSDWMLRENFMKGVILTGLIALSAAIGGAAGALADSVTGCDGKKYELAVPKSYDECMANGRILNCPENKNSQYCRQHFSK